MCFSAEASFAAGAALLPAGAYCTSVAARKRPPYLPLAVIPVVFSFQQFAEGLVWVGLAQQEPEIDTAEAPAPEEDGGGQQAEQRHDDHREGGEPHAQ
jgi:hypothetical protein